MKMLRMGKYLFTFCLLFLLIACAQQTNVSDKNEGAVTPAETGSSVVLGGELRVAYPNQPASLDTSKSTDIVTSEIAKNIFETLVTVDMDFNIKPMLADAWEQSEDGKTIRFDLREGVLFHNGKEMTADDVVASMNRWIQISSAGKESFTGASFHKIDKYTVELQLAHPTSTALAILAHPANNLPGIMPAEIAESSGTEQIQEYIGTAPFRFEAWQKDQHIHLTKFADYQARSEPANGLSGKREALVDDLYYIFVSDSSTRMTGIQSGEYDVAYELSYDVAPIMANDPNITMQTAPAGSSYINFNKRRGIFTNPKAREAIAVGTNKEEILQVSMTSPEFYEPTHHLMMYDQEEQWYSDIGKMESNQYDGELAKKLLTEAGYNGEELIILTTRDREFLYTGAVVLQEQLSRIGVNSKLEVYDWATYVEIRDDENAWDLGVASITPKPEPTSMVFLRNDFSGWTESSELDKVVHEIRSAASLEAAQGLYDDLQAWFIEDKPLVKIGDRKVVYAFRSEVSEIEFNAVLVLWNVSNSK